MPNDPTHREDDSVAASGFRDPRCSCVTSPHHGESYVGHQLAMIAEETGGCPNPYWHHIHNCGWVASEAARREQTAARPAEDAIDAHEGDVIKYGQSYNLDIGPDVRRVMIDQNNRLRYERTPPTPEPAPRRMMGQGSCWIMDNDCKHLEDHDERGEDCDLHRPPCQPLPEPVES